jgi:hypothetical protein
MSFLIIFAEKAGFLKKRGASHCAAKAWRVLRALAEGSRECGTESANRHWLQ